MLSKYLEQAHLPVKRATDKGESRVVQNYKALGLIGRAQNTLNELSVAKKAQFKELHLDQITEEEQDLLKEAAYPAPPGTQTNSSRSQPGQRSGSGGPRRSKNEGSPDRDSDSGQKKKSRIKN